MASRFQAAALVAAPFCPNAVVWSDENLIAVASGHLITILNPALPFGPRGLITIPESQPYPIGVVKREDLLSSCLLSTCLNRDRRPCARSLSWSPVGMAPNSGCLLAVCTAEGHVKIYCPPFCDFGAQWIEVMDLSDKLYDYLASINFEKLDISSVEFSNEDATEHASVDDLRYLIPRKEHKRRRASGVQRQFSAIDVLHSIESFFLSTGASCKLNSASFTVDITALKDHCNAILKREVTTDVEFASNKHLHETSSSPSSFHNPLSSLSFRVSVFQQIPGTLLVKGSLQHGDSPFSGLFSLIFQQLEADLSCKFCREKPVVNHMKSDLANQHKH